MDFRSFSGQNPFSTGSRRQDIEHGKPDSRSRESAGGSNEKSGIIGGMSENDVRRAINYFGGMSNDRLMQELSKLLAAKRREGKEKEVLDTVERIKPLLNPEQRRRVEDILKGMNL